MVAGDDHAGAAAVAAAGGASAVLEHIGPGTDLIVPLANGEPVSLLDAVEAHASDLDAVRVHQMHAIHDRPYLHGVFGDHLRHVSYFLSDVTRPCFRAGTIDLVPNNFSEMRAILTERTTDPLVLAAASRPDRHGYFSLGLNADYVASFIGRARFFLEANAADASAQQLHVSQILGSTSTGPSSRPPHDIDDASAGWPNGPQRRHHPDRRSIPNASCRARDIVPGRAHRALRS